MKKILKKIIKNEKGFALPLVLVLLLLGGLIISPLLGYMTTGLKAGKSSEQLMERLYAADAGIEDAAHKIMFDTGLPQNVGDIVPYTIPDINNKGVTYVIEKEDDAADFIKTMLDIKAQSEAHLDWWDVTDNMSANDTYAFTVTNIQSQNKALDVLGAWFQGTYSVNGAATITSTITTVYDNPVLVVEPFEGGTAILWVWKSQQYGINLDRPTFKQGDQMTVTFHYTPEVVPSLYTAFAKAGSADIGIVGGMLTFGVYKVTSTATDSDTLEQTQIVSYIARMIVASPPNILTWQVSP